MKFTKLDIEPGCGGLLMTYTGRSPEPLRHRHREVEFNLVVEGTGAYLVGSERWPLKPHTLIWLFPEKAHHLVERPAGLLLWVVACREAFLTGLFRENPADSPRNSAGTGALACQLEPREAKRLEQLLEEAHEARASGDLDACNAALGHAVTRAWRLSRGGAEARGREPVHPAILKAIDLLEGGLLEADLREFASRVSLSRAHFIRLFKRQTGMAFSEYRNRVRLEAFFALREGHPGRNLLDLAMESGFGSYLHFYRVFQKVLGLSPREYFRRSSPGESGCPT